MDPVKLPILFTDSPVCKSGLACRTCRDPAKLLAYQATHWSRFAFPEGWQCPKGLPMGWKPATPALARAEAPAEPTGRRPSRTTARVWTPPPNNFPPKGQHVAGPAVDEQWLTVRGPALWGEIHRLPLTCDLSTPEGTAKAKNHLAVILNGIPCGTCKGHAFEYVRDHPPDFSSPLALARWGWEFHNAVNARLKKPQMTWEAADAVYGWEPPPQT